MTRSSALERDDPELGRVRYCRGCREEWPLDETFWFFQRERVMGRCRACWSERVRVNGRARFAEALPHWRLSA